MELELQNFRCFTEKQISFRKNGLILINGKSGHGKSTILNAILFCLYGKISKCQTYGKKSCKVSLRYKNYIITRTKAPNKLIVKENDIEYFEDVAQEIINRLFSPFYEDISYIGQDLFNNFVYKSPTEKLIFLEDFCISKYNIGNIKERIKKELRNEEEQYEKSKTTYETIRKIMDTNIISFPDDFPKKESNIPIYIKNIHTYIKNTLLLIKKSEEKYNIYESDIKTYELNKREYDIYNKQLSEYTELLSLKNKEYNIDFIDDIKEYEEKYEKCKSNRLYIVEKNKYIQKEKEYNDILNKKNNIKLWTKYSENECKNTMKDKEDYYSLEHELNYYNEKIRNKDTIINNMKNIKEKIDICEKCKGDCLVCPSCNTKLLLRNNKLNLRYTEDTFNEILYTKYIKELKEYEKKINEIQIYEEKYNEIKTKINREFGEISNEDKEIWEEISKYYEEMIKCKKEYDYLDKKLSECNLDKKLLNSLKYYDISENEEEILEILKNKRGIKMKREFLYNEIENLKNKIETFESKIETLKNKIENIDYEKTLKNKTKLHKKLEEEREKLKNYEKKRDLTEKCIKYGELIKNYNNEKENMQIHNDNIIGLNMLKEKIVEAESICISGIISDINKNVQYYTDSFFIENPLSVQINLFKENQKPGVKLEISYRGENVEFLSLSGGERQRLNLAFILALSDIQNTPFLLLDECTSNLDLETTNIVLNSIVEVSKVRPIIMCVHQHITGIFDQIIEV